MKRIKSMYYQFMKEPLWFKMLILTTLLVSIIFSSSAFSDNSYYRSLAKLTAAIFFCAYGFKMRRNRQISTVFFVLAVICIYLSWSSLKLT
ncbi:hypothetical protein FHS15_004724 [Paenibacillus castaneae]|nr:hypothetical protein [Paenibacillus castaneae]